VKPRIWNGKRGLYPTVAFALLILAALACEAPAAEPSPTAFVPTETTATVEATPTETIATAEATPTELAPVASPAACPAPASPTLVQPANFADYPTAIQQYLSAGGDLATLESTLASWNALPEDTGQAAAGDLTGDGNAEIVVALRDINAETVFPPGDLLVFGCQSGAYTLLHQEGYESHGTMIQLLQLIDANLDGRQDIAYIRSSCGAHTCYDGLEILGWNGAIFASLMGGALDMPYPTYTVTPGRIEAQSGGIGSVGAEPQRGYTEIWEWNGSVLTVTQQIWAPPVYRYHALIDGDRALLSDDYATASAAYERVISDDALQEWGAVSGMVDPAEERAQLTAFARWRLLLTHLRAGDTASAQSEYNRLQADYPAGATGHAVAALAEIFWTAYQAEGHIADGCAELIAAARVDTSVQDFFNANYGYANPQWEPADLCPFTE